MRQKLRRKPSRPKKVTMDTVLKAFTLTQDTSGAIRLIGELQPSRVAVKKALAALRGANKTDQASALEIFCRHVMEFDPDAPPARAKGKPTPIAGESRSYQIQRNKNGTPFVRLPVTALGVNPGDYVRAAFLDDNVVITRAI